MTASEILVVALTGLGLFSLVVGITASMVILWVVRHEKKRKAKR